MIEHLDDMPEGTIGFRVTGEITRDDYTNVLVPELTRVVEAGGKLRQIYVIEGMKKVDPGAVWEDAKLGFDLLVRHRDALVKAAIVTDQEWLTKAIHLLGWMTPGELRLFPTAELDQAKEWVKS